MRLLVINGNTTDAMTQRIAAAARAVASPGTEIVAATAGFGAAVVGTRAEDAIAAHAVLDAAAQHAGGCDAVVIAISTDAGAWAARELLPIPVVGITEAAVFTACMLGSAFGVLTFGDRAAAWTREMVRRYGASSRLAAIEAPSAPPAAFADPEGYAEPILAGIERLVAAGAEAVVIAGAGFAGMRPILQPRVLVPLVDGVEAGVGCAEMLVRLGFAKPRAGSFAAVGERQARGIGDALQVALLGKGQPPGGG